MLTFALKVKKPIIKKISIKVNNWGIIFFISKIHIIYKKKG
jgi:hypothetical protein